MKKVNTARSLFVVLLSVLMIVSVFPAASGIFGTEDGIAYAAGASGGKIKSGDVSSVSNALGGTATANVSGKTMTITLSQDITLSSAIKFVKGNSGDKIVLNLNGHTITGAAGKDGTDYSAATGKNAIEIAADEFDLEIKGAGSVIGGKGAVYHNNEDGSVGCDGGNAIYFCERVDKLYSVNGKDIQADEGYHPDKLEYGLTITGGAEIVGGAGADVDYDDWLASVKIGYMGVKAGNGGSGIGQVYTGTKNYIAINELSYAKIIIDNGSVRGGSGGNADIGNHIFTRTEIQKIKEIKEFMEGKDANYQFDNHVTESINFGAGDGGRGIEFYAGRKYIDVKKSGSVYGGDGGSVTCGAEASLSKKISSFSGNGGIGIYAGGDTGLTNNEAKLSDNAGDENYWGNKSRYSDDVGIYIAGKVVGGRAPSTTLINDCAGDGGIGIFHLGEVFDSYETESIRTRYDGSRGILLVADTGSVTGGGAGSSDENSLTTGSGGDGIVAGSEGSGNPLSGVALGAGHVVICGNVTGGYGSGNGGDGVSMPSMREDIEGGNSQYFTGYILGYGNIKGGDSGEWGTIGDDSYTTDSQGVISYNNETVHSEAIKPPYNISAHPDAVIVGSGIKESDGEPARIKSQGGFKVAAEMTPFDSVPSTSTKLKCTVTTPSGYNGKVYIRWVSSKIYGSNGESEEYDIEGAGGATNDFALLSDSDYPYGVYKNVYGTGSTDYYMEYFVKVDTLTHMVYELEYNRRTTIYCYATLEDGRTVKSNEIWFSKTEKSETGWTGSSGGSGGNQGTDDSAAVDNVFNLIDSLPFSSDITLADADAVAAARAAYEALTDSQKEEFNNTYRTALEDLKRAEAKIAELKGEQEQKEAEDQEKAKEVIELIEQGLPDLDEIESMDPEAEGYEDAVAEAKAKIEVVTAAYNNLTDDQKRIVEDNGAAYYLNSIVDEFNENYPEDQVDTPVPPVPAATELTASMISVANATYTGAALKPDVTVKADGTTLKNGTDYTVAYKNNTNAGTATVTVTGQGNYTGTASKNFTINPKSITPAVTLSATNYNYSNKVMTPGVTVKDGGKTLPTSQYTVSYASGRKAVGTYSVTVKLKGNYRGSKSASFTIGPKAATISKPKAAKKAITVKWKKQTAKMPKKQITGYQVQYSTNKNMSGAKTKNVKGVKKTSVKIGKLKSKTTYYVRVRTYMKVGGKTYYSNWSGIKSAKAK